MRRSRSRTMHPDIWQFCRSTKCVEADPLFPSAIAPPIVCSTNHANCELQENPPVRRRFRLILGQVIQQHSLLNAGGHHYCLLLLVEMNWKLRRLLQRCQAPSRVAGTNRFASTNIDRSGTNYMERMGGYSVIRTFTEFLSSLLQNCSISHKCPTPTLSLAQTPGLFVLVLRRTVV